MSSYCDYHPVSPAKWRCRKCLKEYCKACVPDANEQKRQGTCPLCFQGLQYLGAANTAIPFWERLPEFFKFPLNKEPIALIAICTFVPMVITSGLIAFIVSLLLLCVLTKYLYSVLEGTSEGQMQPPTLASAFSGEGMNVLFQQIGVFIIAIFIIGGAQHSGGQLLALIVSAFVILVLPASVIILAMEKSVISAINPLQLTLLISTLGWPYFILYTHILLFFLAMGVGADFLLSHSSPLFAYAGVGFINSYFLMIIFHMLGYVLFQYQEKLGYTADEVESLTQANTVANPGRLDADIDLYLKEGDYTRVKQLILDTLKKNRNDPWRLEQLYRLCSTQKDFDSLRPFLIQILDILLVRTQDQEAINLLKHYYKAMPEYALDDPELSFKLAQVAYHLHDYKVIIRLLKDFHKRYGDYVKIPEAYILLAKTLANGLRMKDKAKAYLGYLVKNYPEHDNQPLFQEMLTTVSQGKRL